MNCNCLRPNWQKLIIRTTNKPSIDNNCRLKFKSSFMNSCMDSPMKRNTTLNPTRTAPSKTWNKAPRGRNGSWRMTKTISNRTNNPNSQPKRPNPRPLISNSPSPSLKNYSSKNSANPSPPSRNASSSRTKNYPKVYANSRTRTPKSTSSKRKSGNSWKLTKNNSQKSRRNTLATNFKSW